MARGFEFPDPSLQFTFPGPAGPCGVSSILHGYHQGTGPSRLIPGPLPWLALVASVPSSLSYTPPPDDLSTHSLIYAQTDEKTPETVFQLPTSEQFTFQGQPATVVPSFHTSFTCPQRWPVEWHTLLEHSPSLPASKPLSLLCSPL